MWKAVLLAAVLALPLAGARAPGESYRDEAGDLLAQLDRSVLRARVATVEYAFGDRDARSTAHVMRLEEARVEDVLRQLHGMHASSARARDHATLVQAAAWYADALGRLESCYRHADDEACRAAFVRVSWAQAYRDVAWRALA